MSNPAAAYHVMGASAPQTSRSTRCKQELNGILSTCMMRASPTALKKLNVIPEQSITFDRHPITIQNNHFH